MSYTRQSTIDQHRGEYLPGLLRFELTDVITNLSHDAECPYEELTPEDRDWWDAVLDDLHAAVVEIASLDVDERHAVEAELRYDSDCFDLDDLADYLRRVKSHVLEDLRRYAERSPRD